MKELAGHRMHVPCMSEFFPYAKDEFGWTRIIPIEKDRRRKERGPIKVWGRKLGLVTRRDRC